jgi:hypothetical protein
MRILLLVLLTVAILALVPTAKPKAKLNYCATDKPKEPYQNTYACVVLNNGTTQAVISEKRACDSSKELAWHFGFCEARKYLLE